MLLAVLASLGFCYAVNLSPFASLVTGEKGAPLEAELAAWWTVRAPIAVGAGFLATVALLGLIGAWRRRSLWLAAEVVATVALGALALGCGVAAIRASARPAAARVVGQRCEPSAPSSLAQVFFASEWKELGEAQRVENPAASTIVGPAGYRVVAGTIPRDLRLLKRLTFVGLPVWRVETFLGAGLASPDSPDVLEYRMWPDLDTGYGLSLRLTVSSGPAGDRRIGSESLRTRRPSR